MQLRTNNIYALLAIVGYFLLTRNLLLLWGVQPVGYVTNLYSMFPLSFYMSFIFCYFVAVFLIISKYSKLGICLLCLNQLGVLLIPHMLGYYSIGRADNMSYIGEYLHIVQSANVVSLDIYPASHIIGASISLLSNIEAHNTSFIIPIVFSFVFIIGIYLFSRNIILNKTIRCLVLVSSFIFYIGPYTSLDSPNALFFSFMPLYLYCFHKYTASSNNISLAIIFVLMTLTIPFTHPFIVFFVFSVFLLHSIPRGYLLHSIPRDYSKIHLIKPSTFLLLAVVFGNWFIQSKLLTYSKKNYMSFIERITDPVFIKTTDKISKIQLGFFDYGWLINIFYGRFVIPTLFIFVSFIIVYRNRHILKSATFKGYPYLVLLYFAFLFLQFILYFNPLISHQPDRIANLNFIVYAQVPLFSYALYLILIKDSIKLKNGLRVCVILTLIWSLSLFGCFDSPYIYRTNAALTYNEVGGMSWLYNVKDNSNVSAPISQINRFYHLFGDFENKGITNDIPDHFGYINGSDTFINKNLGASYVVLLTLDEMLYQKVPGYTTVGRYTAADFSRFRRDDSINKIYDSLNIEIFKSAY